MIELFFSYSHRDEHLRDELETHLAMLKRQGLVRAWHDRRIPPGDEIDHRISEHLENADVILLLVSPYFLASDYCYDVETARALARHDAGEAIVVPVILQPCDWKNAPFGRLRATPQDGKPVMKFANAHDAFLEITNDIRWAAERLGKDSRPTPQQSAAVPPTPGVRTSNLRIKKSFTDRERDGFVDEAFAYIRRFFENSLEELQSRNPDLEYRFKNTAETGFTAAIYLGGEKRTSCSIWLPGRNMFGGDITYAASDSLSGNSFNDSMHVEDDGYTLGLNPLGLSQMGQRSEELLTPHGAAEYFWSVLVSRLQ